MKAMKVIVKILLLPVILVLTLILWIAVFLNSISGIIMGILSFVIVLTGTASLLFSLASGREFLEMIAGAFVIFVIPHIGNWLIEKITLLRYMISDFIRS